MLLVSLQNHGWDEDCNFTWSESIYPADVVSFFEDSAAILNEDEEECSDLEEDDINDIFEMNDNHGEDDYF